MESRLSPATHIWSGLSPISADWSDNLNWSGGAPVVGESDVALSFPIASQPTNFNDISRLTVSSIEFTASGYILSGNPLTMTGNTAISAVAVGPVTIELSLNQQPVFAGSSVFFDHVFDIADLATLDVQGQIIGAPILNSLDKLGGGTLKLSNSANDFGALSEMQSLRLGMAMDRLAKLFMTLSNLEKKIADTAQTCVGNIR